MTTRMASSRRAAGSRENCSLFGKSGDTPTRPEGMYVTSEMKNMRKVTRGAEISIWQIYFKRRLRILSLSQAPGDQTSDVSSPRTASILPDNPENYRGSCRCNLKAIHSIGRRVGARRREICAGARKESRQRLVRGSRVQAPSDSMGHAGPAALFRCSVSEWLMLSGMDSSRPRTSLRRFRRKPNSP